MEAKNHPIEKEKHLPSIPGCNHRVVAVFGLEWKFLPADPRRYLKEWRLIRQPGVLELQSFCWTSSHGKSWPLPEIIEHEKMKRQMPR